MIDGARGPLDSETRRRFLASVAGTAALAGAPGCQSLASTADGGSLRFAQAKAPVEFDPVVLDDVPSGEVAGMIFDTLYGFDEAGTGVVPKLAASDPEVDRGGRRWTVALDPDARFQNGDPVTAEDVKHSFLAPMEEETANAGEVNMIESVTALDESTVQFDLQYEFAPFPAYLTRAVVPKAVRTADRQAFNTEDPVGAGPFELERWTQGEEVVLTRWDDYWDEPRPNLSGITFVPVTEPTTRITTLRNGTNDVVKSVPPQSWETVAEMDGASVEATRGMNYLYLAFNCNEGPATDPQVREAVDYAFSMDRAVGRFVEPTGVRQHTPLPPALLEDWAFPVEEWRSMASGRDVDRTKALLDDSDAVDDDWTATIIVPPDEKREQIALSVANGIEAAGYEATVRRLGWSTFLEQYVSGSADAYDLFAYGWAGAPDPDAFVYFLFSHAMHGVTNGTYYENEAMNDRILAARRSTDRAERRDLYAEVITTVLEDRVHLPAYALKNSFGVRDAVRDFRAHPTDQFSIVSDYNNVSLQ